MIKKITSLLVALPLYASAVTLADFSKDNLAQHPYDETKFQSSKTYEGEPVVFGDFEIKATPEYQKSVAFINAQEHLSQFRREILKMTSFSVAYSIQNAGNKAMISKFSETSYDIDLCVYVGLTPDTQFIIEKSISNSLKDGDDLERLLAVSNKMINEFEITSPNEAFDRIMKCSEFLKKNS